LVGIRARAVKSAASCLGYQPDLDCLARISLDRQVAGSAPAIPTDRGTSFERVNWTILETPEQIVGGSYDGIAWTWRLRDDAGHERALTFQVTGTAMSREAVDKHIAERKAAPTFKQRLRAKLEEDLRVLRRMTE
jgi:hypothetical protein